MLRRLCWLAAIAKARLLGRPLGLSHEDDADGIVSAALFLRKHPDGVIVLAGPKDVERAPIRWATWDFVADLPCPPRAKLRVDHHRTNAPRAEREVYDPEAPCAAILALRALGLEDDEVARRLAELAAETDTANIVSPEAWDLNDAVKGAGYLGRVWLAARLAREGPRALDHPKVRKWVEKHRRIRENTVALAAKLEVAEVMIVLVERGTPISHRGLCIELERHGALMTCVVRELGLLRRRYRLYLGAVKGSGYDVSEIARRLGGGGHPFAAGAVVDDLRAALDMVMRHAGGGRVAIYRVDRRLRAERLASLK